MHMMISRCIRDYTAVYELQLRWLNLVKTTMVFAHVQFGFVLLIRVEYVLL